MMSLIWSLLSLSGLRYFLIITVSFRNKMRLQFRPTHPLVAEISVLSY